MMDWISENLKVDGSMHMSTTEDFYGYTGDADGCGIWLSAEDRAEYKGEIVYDYWSIDHDKRSFGVLNAWEEQLAKRGWYSQWNDAGTVMIYKI
jgi:hypothetical protein